MTSATWLAKTARDAAAAVRRFSRARSSSRRGRPSHSAARSNAAEQLERRTLLAAAIAAFGAPPQFATGTFPRSVTVADLNRDAKPDLVIPNNHSDSVSIVLGHGDGTFATQQTYAAGNAPYSAAVTDFNGDGVPDLAVIGNTDRFVSVLIGNGDGTFAAPRTLEASTLLTSVATADFNGDGKADIVVSNDTNATVSVFLGNGDGAFQKQHASETAPLPVFISVSDFNGDGKPDLAIAHFPTPKVDVLIGNGDGSFQDPQTYAVGTAPQNGPGSLAVADANLDGHPDILTSTGYILTGNSDGAFAQAHTFASLPNRSILVADINSDGRPDAVTDTWGSSGGVAIGLLGNGDGTFQPRNTFFSGPGNPYDMAGNTIVVADLNGDGRQDIVTTNPKVNTVSVLLGDVPPTVISINRTNPAGQIISDITSVTYTVTFSEPVTGVDPTDFQLATTGVTVSDPIVVTPVSGSVYTVSITGISGLGTLGLNLVDNGSIKNAAGNPLQGGGAASFLPVQNLNAGYQPQNIEFADLNGDGQPDLLTMSRLSLTVFLGNGDGTFTSPTWYSTDVNAWPLNFVDVNNDGKLDVVTWTTNGAGIFFSNGNGTFQPETIVNTAPAMYTGRYAADFNHDGKIDLLSTTTGNSPLISIFPGNGDGTFNPPVTSAIPFGPFEFSYGDINKDGNLDILVDSKWALFGNGDGTFRPLQTVAAGLSITTSNLADVNRDGNLDIVADNVGKSIAVALGNGNGAFKAPYSFADGNTINIYDLIVTDLNADGKPDILFDPDHTTTGLVGILFGNGDGTFAPQQSLGTLYANQALAVADINHDARPDLFVVQTFNSTVGEYLATPDGSLAGETYTLVQRSDIIQGTSASDQITLTKDPAGPYIDWTIGPIAGQMLINDPAGLTIFSNGSNDIISLDYSNGNPFPRLLNLNGTFTFTDSIVQGFSGCTIDIGQSTVYFDYFVPALDIAPQIQSALKVGYNGGRWGASAFATAITSSAAALDPARYSVGYADSADGTGVVTTPNTIEIKYTLAGDANLNGAVDMFDLNTLLAHFNAPAPSWTTGDFTYNGKSDIFDLNALLPNFNQALPAASSAPSPLANFASPSQLSALQVSAASAQTNSPSTLIESYGHPFQDEVHNNRRHPRRPKKSPL